MKGGGEEKKRINEEVPLKIFVKMNKKKKILV